MIQKQGKYFYCLNKPDGKKYMGLKLIVQNQLIG